MIDLRDFNIPNFKVDLVISLDGFNHDHVSRLLPVFGFSHADQLISHEFVEFDKLFRVFKSNNEIAYIRIVQEEFGIAIHGCNIPGFEYSSIIFWKLVIGKILTRGSLKFIISRCMYSNKRALRLLMDSGFIVSKVWNINNSDMVVDFLLDIDRFNNSRLCSSNLYYSKCDLVSLQSNLDNRFSGFNLYKASILLENEKWISSRGDYLIIVDYNNAIMRFSLLQNTGIHSKNEWDLLDFFKSVKIKYELRPIIEIRIEKCINRNIFILFGNYLGENEYFWIFNLSKNKDICHLLF